MAMATASSSRLLHHLYSYSDCAPSHSLRPWRPRPVSLLCQAQSSYEKTVVFHKQPSSCSITDLRQQEFPGHEAVNRRDGNGVHQLQERLSLLQAQEDCYDGVIVDPSSLPSDVDTFTVCLRASLSYWRSQNKKGVWLKLPTQNAAFVPVAIKEGFQYHHAEPTHVMMTYWLPDSPSTLPPNASHQVGIGAFVMNEFREVLVVQEKNGPLRGSGVWKMPTGLINQAEDLCAGAVREVKEETGVDTEFVEVVGFRLGHYFSFGKSDLYFVCILRPLSMEITEQDGEIEAAKWMPLEEFRSQAFYRENNLRKKIIDLSVASFDRQYKGLKAVQAQIGSQVLPCQFFFRDES